jgi:lipoate-protein ligase A
MILWCDGAHDAAENMRRDAALLAAVSPDREPVLRLFRFRPPGITLGHAQDPERELDLERCARDGVGVAVRPTGGRAIFHAEEWTYALAAPREHREWGGRLADAYARASTLVVRSLVRLGVPAAFARGETSGPGGRVRPPGGGPAAPCFASTARHEVTLMGRKLVGSAQRRTDRAILQQGSVLIGPGHLRLADYLRLPEAERDEARAALARATAPAGHWLGPDPPLEHWAAALMTELGTGVPRVDGPQGAFLLTVGASGSYTPARAN